MFLPRENTDVHPGYVWEETLQEENVQNWVTP